MKKKTAKNRSAPKRKAPVKAGMKEILLVLLSPIVFLALLEGAARLFEEKRPDGVTLAGLQPDPVLHHRWGPRLNLTDRARGEPVLLRTNSQHWVERYDVAEAKPAGTYRIFYLGDSNTQGVVQFGQKVADIVETKLNESYQAKGRTIEVINTGTSSYANLQYYLIASQILPRYSPDLVMIQVDMTDVPNDRFYRTLAKFDAQGNPVAVFPSSEGPRDTGSLRTARSN